MALTREELQRWGYEPHEVQAMLGYQQPAQQPTPQPVSQPSYSAQPVGQPVQSNAPGLGGFQLPQLSQYDAQFGAAQRAIQEQIAGLASEQELQTRRVNEDYETRRREMDQDRQRALEELEARMAGQGILRSGINVEQQGRLGQRFTEASGNLGTQRARSVEDIVRAITGRRQELQREHEQVGLERARANAQAAIEAALERARQQAQQEMINQMQPQPTPTGQYTPGMYPGQGGQGGVLQPVIAWGPELQQIQKNMWYTY